MLQNSHLRYHYPSPERALLSVPSLALVAAEPVLPDFIREVTTSSNKEVKPQGFMMPLLPGKKQKHLLISVNPTRCALRLPTGGAVEVKPGAPVRLTLEPVQK